jgi:predicted RecB family endonuclease
MKICEEDLKHAISRKNQHVVGFVVKVKDKAEAEEIEACIKSIFSQSYIINVKHCMLPDKIIQVLQSEVKVNKPHVGQC